MPEQNPSQEINVTVQGDAHLKSGANLHDISGRVAFAQVGGNLTGDIIAGNKTIINNIIQQAAKQIVTAPYKFLASYDICDRDIFFGRDAVIEELVGKLLRYKTLVINGRSGSGKTSLINAGLIPRLAEHGYHYLSFREYNDPLRQLQAHVAHDDLLKAYAAQTSSLLRFLTTITRQQKQHVAVIFDQFERFFINVLPPVRTQFIQEIKACLDSDLSGAELDLVFALREEYFGQLTREFGSLIPTFIKETDLFNLEPLNRTEARDAILKPLEHIPLKIGYDPEFVDSVLLPGLMGESAGGLAIDPPHLQIVCNQLYEQAKARNAVKLERGGVVEINRALYDELQGTTGILQSYLDDRLAKIAPQIAGGQAVLRSMLKTMIAAIGTTGTRKFVTLHAVQHELADVAPEVVTAGLRALREERIIEMRGQGETASYSLSHEVMVEKVQSWYDEREMERKKAQETLERGLAEWKSSQALLNEKQVTHIRAHLGGEGLSAEAEQLLAQSQQAYEERQCKEAEQEHKIRAEEDARRKAEKEYAEEQRKRAEEAEQHAAVQARSVSRIKKLAVGLAVFLIAAIGAAGFAWFQEKEAVFQRKQAETRRQEAEYQTRVAKAGQLAAQAKALLEQYSQRSLLLAIEAMQISLRASEPPIPSAEQALRDILSQVGGEEIGRYQKEIVATSISPDDDWFNSVPDTPNPDDDWLATIDPDAPSPDDDWFNSVPDASRIPSTEQALRDIPSQRDILTQVGGKEIDGYEKEVVVTPISPDDDWFNSVLDTPNPDDDWLATSDPDAPHIPEQALRDLQTKLRSQVHTTEGRPPIPEQALRDIQPQGGGEEIGEYEKRVVVPPISNDDDWFWLATSDPDAPSPDDDWLATSDPDTPSPDDDWLATSDPDAPSPDDDWLATNDPDAPRISPSAVQALRRNRLAQVRGEEIGGYEKEIVAMRISPDNHWLATGDLEGTIRLWDLMAANATKTGMFLYKTDAIKSMEISPDGRWLVVDNDSLNTLQLWDLKSAKPRTNSIALPYYSDTSFDLEFSSDDRWLVTGTIDGTIQCFDLNSTDPTSPLLVLREDEPVHDVEISPDNHWLISRTGNGRVRLWNLTLANPSANSIELTESDQVAFSPDSHWLATISQTVEVSPAKPRAYLFKGGVNLWNLRELELNSGGITPIVLDNGGVKIRNMEFDSNSHWLITGSNDGTARLWNINADDPTANSLMVLGYQRRGTEVVAISPDNRWFVTISGLPTENLSSELYALENEFVTVELWDLKAENPAETGRLLYSTTVSSTTAGRGIENVVFSSDSRWLAIRSGDNNVKLWDLGELNFIGMPEIYGVALHGHDKGISAMIFSSDSRQLITAGKDGTLRLWNLTTSDLPITRNILIKNIERLNDIAISPDGHWLITFNFPTSHGTFPETSIWNITGIDPVESKTNLRTHDKMITAKIISKDGRYLALAYDAAYGGDYDDGTVSLCQFKTADPIINCSTLSGHQGSINGMMISADSRWLITGSVDGTVRRWDLEAADMLLTSVVFDGHGGSITAVAMSADNRWLIVGSEDGTIRRWDMEAADMLSTSVVFDGHGGSITAVAMSADNRWLIAGSKDGTVRRWDLMTNNPTTVSDVLIENKKGIVPDILVSQNRWFITKADTCQLWDLMADDLAGSAITLHNNPGKISISEDGRWLVIADNLDNTVRVWDLISANPTAASIILGQHKKPIVGVGITKDNRWVVSGSNDDTVRRWMLRIDDVIDLACRIAGRNLSDEEWKQYLPGEKYQQTCPDLPVHPGMSKIMSEK